MANPLTSLLPKDPDTGPGIGVELGEKARSIKTARQGLESNPEPAKPAKPVMGAPSHMTPTKGPYGTNPGTGEKKLPVDEWMKGAPAMHKGGTVPKTGPYIMKEGEKVLTPEQHGHIAGALSLAQSALSHDPAPEPPKPAKVGGTFNARRLDDKSFHVRKGHTSPEHPDEESSAPDMKGLIKHLQDHFGKDEPESPGVGAAEQAVGLEK
jgi:hypothetical protein